MVTLDILPIVIFSRGKFLIILRLRKYLTYIDEELGANLGYVVKYFLTKVIFGVMPVLELC